MTKHAEAAFAVARPDGSLMVRTTTLYAADSRKAAIPMVSVRDNETWPDLYRRGYRVVRVDVVPR